MRIVFCSDPLNPRRPDAAYAREVDSARRLEIPFDFIDHDAICAGRTAEVARRLTVLEKPELALFRGWMLRPVQYERLYGLMREGGRLLVNSPAEYLHAHHLPESYGLIEGRTPRSVWLPVSGMPAIGQVMELLEPFGDRPVVLKDYVKSQKHDWAEACFIPSATDRSAVERVVRRFLELQGADLNEGLVFREFVEFESVGVHPKSGMPLSREFRLFFFRGRPLLHFRYWDDGSYGDEAPRLEAFAEVAAQVQSQFFTMDVARRTGGDWMIVELGDGQVAGLPEGVDPQRLFEGLRAAST